MSDAGGMGMARPEYDPARDPGNYPLVFLRAPVERIQYDAHLDQFTAVLGHQWLHVNRARLRYIYGLPGWQSVEVAVIDYFQHEALFRSLTPATEA